MFVGGGVRRWRKGLNGLCFSKEAELSNEGEGDRWGAADNRI